MTAGRVDIEGRIDPKIVSWVLDMLIRTEPSYIAAGDGMINIHHAPDFCNPHRLP